MKNNRGDFVRIRGARVHNLKNVNVDIPKGKLVVITGLSGSGKSSLAFDTIYAEAERRYVESLSSYARQFLGVKEKPEVESIDGLSPAISIDQKSVTRNPRSTVGTITEIYDFLRILFARIGHPYCPQCTRPVSRQSMDQMVDAIGKLGKGIEMMILAPVVAGKKGEHRAILEEIKRGGFLRVRMDGALLTLDEAINRTLDKKKPHTIEAVVDRFTPDAIADRARIRDSVETALKAGKGMLTIACAPGPVRGAGKRGEDEDHLFSERFACLACNINLPDIEPRTFSFNSPYGACETCTGLGSTLEVNQTFVLPNRKLSINEGAIAPWSHASHRVGRQSWYGWMLDDVAMRYNFSLKDPIEKLPPAVIEIILNGEPTAKNDKEGGDRAPSGRDRGTFEGVIPNLKRRWKETDSEFTRREIEKYMTVRVCPQCEGKRLRLAALAVQIEGTGIAAITDLTIDKAQEFFKILASERSSLLPHERVIAAPLVKEIAKRLEFLRDVGLEYLTLARESTTLSGGEAQRIQLATQIGSRLTGILYILDEPSIGLHPRDHARLIATLKNLRDLGNTVIVVEHDAETMRNADWIIDIGPGAGKNGGRIIFEGTPAALTRASTLTGAYLSGAKRITAIKTKALRTKEAKKYLSVHGARAHNLKNITVRFPLGKFVCVTGVSGSGKSTLVNDILAKALLAKFYGAHLIPGAHEKIEGTENLNKAVVVDQSPIGRTPRSNAATYTGAFGLIRDLFAKTIDARSRGYTPGRFSFNVKGGRCEQCEGQGVKKIEMYFLPDVYIQCEECRGKRYNREALEIEYGGKNIAEVLDMSIEESLEFFKGIPLLFAKLKTLAEVGLGYMKVGQPAPTLSGGEAQRVKLATELSRRDTGASLYILDEPTTGLHFDDIQKLLNILMALVTKGNTVLVIEHNPDIVRNADWIIDLGPEGGDAGGEIVAEGTVTELIKNKKSHTGKWLK